MISVLFILSSCSKELSDDDPVISLEDISIYIKSARCLSIKSSIIQKNSFISKKFIDIESFVDAYDEAAEKDSYNIKIALKKYCPESYLEVKKSLSEVSRKERICKEIVFEDIIITTILEQTQDEKTRNDLFIKDYEYGNDTNPF